MLAPLLATAKIGKTHGIDGFLRVYSLSGEYSHLKKLKSCVAVLPSGEELTLCVDSIQVKGDVFLMKFSSYSSPEKARILSNATIMIPRSSAPKLKKGEYYIADLYGMDVLVDGKKVGKIEYTMEGAQSLLLSIVRDDNKKSYLVPNLPVYVNNISIENNSLDLIAPYLLDIE